MTSALSSVAHRHILPLSLLLLIFLSCDGFMPGPAVRKGRTRSLFQSSFLQEQPSSQSTTNNSSNNLNANSVDSMRNDIAAMKREAQRRLDALTMDLEEFRSSKQQSSSYLGNEAVSSVSLDCLEGDLTKVATTLVPTPAPKDEDVVIVSTPLTSDMPTAEFMKHPVDVNLLDNTRWKIVFNLGREPGTWMPPAWGASGNRMRFTVVVDLLDESLDDRDDFLEGMVGTKKLRVLEAWLGPTYDSSYHGRRNLRVGTTGGYKVVRGAGPLGTDVFRFYIEAEEAFRAAAGSDVYCPRGRIYGNCGYFPTLDPQVRDAFHAYKDRLQKEHRATVKQYGRLQQEREEDGRFMSWDRVKRMNEEMKIRKKLQDLDHKISEARQREPEKGHLRLSRRGDVGLTKDGGICCKVQKGLALEYHILGRMEIAAVETDHGDIHEEYEDLVHKLHP